MKDDARIVTDIEDRLRRLENRPKSSGGGSGAGLKHQVNADRSTGAQALGVGSGQSLRANNIYQDPEGLFDAATGFYLLPEDGWYLLSLTVDLTGGAAGEFYWNHPGPGADGPRQTSFVGETKITMAGLVYIYKDVAEDGLIPQCNVTSAGGFSIRNLSIAMIDVATGGGGTAPLVWHLIDTNEIDDFPTSGRTAYAVDDQNIVHLRGSISVLGADPFTPNTSMGGWGVPAPATDLFFPGVAHLSGNPGSTIVPYVIACFGASASPGGWASLVAVRPSGLSQWGVDPDPHTLSISGISYPRA